jgi:hypothetical protein
MKTIQYTLENIDGIATITFDEPNSPVNTMCLQWQDDMTEVAAQVLKDKDAIQGHLLASAKIHFSLPVPTSRPPCASTLGCAEDLYRNRAPQEKLPRHRNPGQAGGQPAQRHGAGRRLGSGTGRPPPHRH